MYLDHLKCVLMVKGMSVVVNVMLSLISVMSPPPALCNLSVPNVDVVVAVTVMRVLLFVLHVCMLRECEGDGNAGVGVDEVWLW